MLKKYITLSEAEELIKKSRKTIRRFAKEEESNEDTLNVRRVEGKFGEEIEVLTTWIQKEFIPKQYPKEELKKMEEEFMSGGIRDKIIIAVENISRGFGISGMSQWEIEGEALENIISKIPKWFEAEKKAPKVAWAILVAQRYLIDQQRGKGKLIKEIFANKTFTEKQIDKQDRARVSLYGKSGKRAKTLSEDDQERSEEKEKVSGIELRTGMSIDKNDEQDNSTGSPFLDGNNYSKRDRQVILEGLFNKKPIILEEEQKKHNKNGRRIVDGIPYVRAIVWDKEMRRIKKEYSKFNYKINSEINNLRKELKYALLVYRTRFKKTGGNIEKIIHGASMREVVEGISLEELKEREVKKVEKYEGQESNSKIFREGYSPKKDKFIKKWTSQYGLGFRQTKSLFKTLFGFTFEKNSFIPRNKDNSGIWDKMSSKQKKAFFESKEIETSNKKP